MERIESIDVLRGIAIFLVVFAHVLELNSTKFLTFPLYNWTYSFHMPLFMCISGFVTSYSYRESKKLISKDSYLYIAKKFQSIIVPYILWGAVIGPLFFSNFKNLDYSYIFQAMFVTNHSYWFLPCLFGEILLFFLYRHLRSSFKKELWYLDWGIIFILVGITMFLYEATKYDFFRFIVNYSLSFFIGVYVAQNLKLRALFFDNTIIYAICLILFCLIDGLFIKDAEYSKIIKIITGSLALPICFYFVNHFKFSAPIKENLILIGQNTLVIYVAHFPFLIMMKYTGFFDNFNIVLQIFIGGSYSILLIYLCIFFAKVLDRSPILGRYLLGKK